MVEVVRVNGLEIAYERVGEGPPLVLVHGAAEDGRVWQPQFAALADEFTLIAWDEPGAGRSSDLPADFGLACPAAALDLKPHDGLDRRRGRERQIVSFDRAGFVNLPGLSIARGLG